MEVYESMIMKMQQDIILKSNKIGARYVLR